MARSKGAIKYLLPVKSPCKDCEARAIGCHGSCEKYAAYRSECAALAAEYRKKSEYNAYIERQLKRMPKERRL